MHTAEKELKVGSKPGVSKSAGRVQQVMYKWSFSLVPRKVVVYSLLRFSHNPGKVLRRCLETQWSFWILPKPSLACVIQHRALIESLLRWTSSGIHTALCRQTQLPMVSFMHCQHLTFWVNFDSGDREFHPTHGR